MKLLAVLILSFFVFSGPVSSLFLSASSSAMIDRESQSSHAPRNVSYKGVSFSLDHSLASEVRSQTIPATVEGKPSDVWPEHPSFTFIGYPRPRSLPPADPHVRVFSVAKFREALAIASNEMMKTLVYPKDRQDWTLYLDEEARVLNSLLRGKHTQANLPLFLGKVRRRQPCEAMPFLPLWEACQAFIARTKYVKFKNGEGAFFLTQWDTETTQVTNEGLEYAFQGITDDGRYYVYAEFSVVAPLLPNGDAPDVMRWNEKNYLLPHKSGVN